MATSEAIWNENDVILIESDGNTLDSTSGGKWKNSDGEEVKAGYYGNSDKVGFRRND